MEAEADRGDFYVPEFTPEEAERRAKKRARRHARFIRRHGSLQFRIANAAFGCLVIAALTCGALRLMASTPMGRRVAAALLGF